MKAIRFVVVFAVAWCMQAGMSFAMEDWLDKLSGPGPFRGHGVGYRFLCVSNAADQEDFRMVSLTGPTTGTPFVEKESTLVTWLGPHERSAFVIPRKLPDKVPSPATPPNPASLREYRKMVAEVDCKSDLRLRGYASVTGLFNQSYKNNLFPADPDNGRYRVRILDLSVGYTVRLNRALDVGASFGLSRFSGKVFDPFYRHSLTPISLEFSPLAVPRDGERVRAIKVGVAATTFFPGFEASDFCDRGPAACAGIREFKSSVELIPRVYVVVDLSLFSKITAAVALCDRRRCRVGPLGDGSPRRIFCCRRRTPQSGLSSRRKEQVIDVVG